jgi:glycosyltransferase involved in cell wall biosynthesis
VTKKKVLFDASPMLGVQKSGVGYYVNHLIDALQQNYSEELALSGYYFNFLGRRPIPLVRGVSLIPNRVVPGKLLSLCRRLGFQPFLELFFPGRYDTVLFTNYVSLPTLKKRQIVLAIYDLGFLDHPEFTQEANLNFLNRYCPASIMRADTIITISQFTEQRLHHYFPDLTAKIIVTPIPPARKEVQREDLNSRLTTLGVRPKKYLLYLGTVEPRKNIQNLVSAYSLLDNRTRGEYSLVIAGGKGWKDDAILSLIATHKSQGLNVIQTGYVSDREKAALYSQAACFVLPSHYEGFGMPVLEAMQYGIPIAVSDLPVFREVAEGSVLYFAKDDPADIAQKIATILSDKTLRDKLIRTGDERLNAFSWDSNATKVFDAL